MSTTVGPDDVIDGTALVAPAPPPNPLHNMSPDLLVQKYLQLRQRKDEIRKRHTEELAPYTAVMNMVETRLLEILQQNKVRSMRADAGTFHTHTRTSAKVTDWPAVLQFIQQTGAWDLLEQRVSKLAVEAIIEETRAGVPGVDVVREMTVQVRSAS